MAICEGICVISSDQKAGDEESVAVGNQELVRHLSGNSALSSRASSSNQSPHFMAEGNAGKLAPLSVTLK